jgi:hypothetical protein
VHGRAPAWWSYRSSFNLLDFWRRQAPRVGKSGNADEVARVLNHR